MFSDILLAVDFDRTLTGTDSSVPQNNLDAIRYFMDNGGIFTVNSGRSLPMAEKNILGRIPVNAPLLLYNGSAAFDTAAGKLTQVIPIALDAAALAEDLQSRFPTLTVEIQAVDGHYIFRKNRDWEIFTDNNHCRRGYITPRQIPAPFIKMALYGDLSGHSVGSMYSATDGELALFDEAVRYIEATYGDRVDVFRACAKIADLHGKGVSKLRSARMLQKSLGRKLLICVGDAENDIPMLEGADFAFCPADGVVADRFETVCACDEGAVADVIRNKIPGILR